jgi:hypothetical protein
MAPDLCETNRKLRSFIGQGNRWENVVVVHCTTTENVARNNDRTPS